MSLWGLACLDVFYVGIFGETFMEDPLIVNVHFYVGNICVQLLKGLAKGPIRRTQGLSRPCLGSVNRLNQTRSTWLDIGPLFLRLDQ